MKKQLIFASMSAILALAVAQSAYATPTNINDDYVGGDNHGYGDVIGKKAWFDIYSMDVERIGNMLSVTINTNFAGRGDDRLFNSSTRTAASGYDGVNLDTSNGIGYGDLFLSSSWTPVGNAATNYVDDNFYAVGTTDWSYAFSLDDRWATNGGNGSLYSLNGLDGEASDILLSEDFLNRNTFRNGQEIAVKTDGKDPIPNSSPDDPESNTWSIIADTDTTVGKIHFLIDLTGTSLAGSDTIALHWGMTCGNDTIEGEYSVPEPAMLGLLALGLIGIGVSQRKRS